MNLNQDMSLVLQNLHDSTLVKVEIIWAESLCRLHLIIWSESQSELVPILVESFGVHSVSVPRAEPWGPSSSVNSATYSAGVLNVEMQSGDLISVSSAGYRVLPSNHSL